MRMIGMPVTCRIASSGFICINAWTGSNSTRIGIMDPPRSRRPWRYEYDGCGINFVSTPAIWDTACASSTFWKFM